MRVEVYLQDNSPEAIVLAQLADPSSYLLNLIRQDKGSSIASRAVRTPDWREIIKNAQESPNRFQSKEQVDEYLEKLRSEW